MSVDQNDEGLSSTSPVGGRLLVLAAAQELRPVLHAAKSIGMEYVETSLGKNLVGHRLTWKHASGTTHFWLAVAVQQGVDAVNALVTRLCERFSPASVILTGMMGGVPNKIRFLDLVVPTVIYDGRIVGTKDKEILVEPEPARVHPSIHAIVNNIPDFEIEGVEIVVKKNKKSLTVAAKHDDISHELFQRTSATDPENIVAFEMEGQAIAYLNLFQQLDGENVDFGMVKGVADFGGMESGQSEQEINGLKQQIGYIADDGPFDPITNSVVKKKLQFEATKRALVVSAEISRRVGLDLAS